MDCAHRIRLDRISKSWREVEFLEKRGNDKRSFLDGHVVANTLSWSHTERKKGKFIIGLRSSRIKFLRVFPKFRMAVGNPRTKHN